MIAMAGAMLVVLAGMVWMAARGAGRPVLAAGLLAGLMLLTALLAAVAEAWVGIPAAAAWPAFFGASCWLHWREGER